MPGGYRSNILIIFARSNTPLKCNGIYECYGLMLYNPCQKPMAEWQPEAKRRGLYKPSNFAKHIRILQNYWKVRSTTGLPVGLYIV